MNPRPPTSEDTHDRNTALNTVLRVFTRQRQSKQSDASTVQSKVRVSKPMLRTRTFKASKSKPVVVDLDVMMPIRIQQMPKRRETQLSYAKKNQSSLLDQLRPQRVSKSSRFAAISTKSRPGIRCHGSKQIRYQTQRQHGLT